MGKRLRAPRGANAAGSLTLVPFGASGVTSDVPLLIEISIFCIPISILPFPPPVFALDDATASTRAHLLPNTRACRRRFRSESGETAKRACCSTAQSLIWHRKDAPTNPRGIPFAPFVDKVEDYVSSRSEVDGTMKNFQEMIS